MTGDVLSIVDFASKMLRLAGERVHERSRSLDVVKLETVSGVASGFVVQEIRRLPAIERSPRADLEGKPVINTRRARTQTVAQYDDFSI